MTVSSKLIEEITAFLNEEKPNPKNGCVGTPTNSPLGGRRIFFKKPTSDVVVDAVIPKNDLDKTSIEEGYFRKLPSKIYLTN